MPKIEQTLTRPRNHQLRVLRVLEELDNHPLTKTRLAEEAGVSSGLVGEAIGSDSLKQAERDAKDGYPCLLVLGYVERHESDVDGITEVTYSLTRKGLEALSAFADVILPPPASGK